MCGAAKGPIYLSSPCSDARFVGFIGYCDETPRAREIPEEREECGFVFRGDVGRDDDVALFRYAFYERVGRGS